MAKILTFNMDMDNLVFCDKYYNNKTTKLVPKEGRILTRAACYNPFFFDKVAKEIAMANPELIIFVTFNENPNSYFHTDFLPELMYYGINTKDINFIYNQIAFVQNKEKNINLSVYQRGDLTSYDVTDVYYDNHAVYYSMALDIDTPYGLLTNIALNWPDSEGKLDYKSPGYLQLLKDVQLLYLTKSINYELFYSHLPNGLEYQYDNLTKYDDTFTEASTFIAKYQLTEIKEQEIIFDLFNSKHIGKLNVFEFKREAPKILCFSWNTDNLPLCDKYRDDKTMGEKQRTRFLFHKNPCYNPLFFDTIKEKMNLYHPELVAITTEGDLEKNTYFHAEFLPTQMEALGYTLLERQKLSDIDINQSAMRLSIYTNNEKNKIVHINRSFLFNNEDYSCQSNFGTSKALVKYVKTEFGIIAFAGVELAEQTEYLDMKSHIKCLKNIEDYLLNSKELSHVIVMGDFSTSAVTSKIDNQDLLKQYWEGSRLLDGYQEGNGQLLQPNYKLISLPQADRDEFNFDNLQFYDYQTWHDRIFYKTEGVTNSNLVCLEYETIFKYPMLERPSEHLGVLAVLELQAVAI